MKSLGIAGHSALLAGLGLMLTSVHAAAADNGYSLQARPSVCVSYDNEQPCTMALELSWKGPARPQLCLYEVPLVQTLHCWLQAGTGSLNLDFTNTVDVIYRLPDAAIQGPLADTNVKVINRDLRSSRKRRRHVWSIL